MYFNTNLVGTLVGAVCGLPNPPRRQALIERTHTYSSMPDRS